MAEARGDGERRPTGRVTASASWLLGLVLFATDCRARSAPELGASSSSSARAVAGGHLVIEHASAGSAESAVLRGLSTAQAAHRRLVVYVGATWCEPCQRFHQAAERGELDAAFPDLTLLEFDADADNARLATAGYVSKYVPLFALPKSDGRASGQQIEGTVKGDSAVANIVPRLLGLLAR